MNVPANQEMIKNQLAVVPKTQFSSLVNKKYTYTMQATIIKKYSLKNCTYPYG